MDPADRLPPVLEAQLALVKEALRKIGAEATGEPELRNLRAFLVNILDVVEPTQPVDQAADELYEAALALQRTRGRTSAKSLSTRATRPGKALATLRAALRSAKPAPISGKTLS